MNAISISAVVLAVAALIAPGSVPAGTSNSLQRCEGSDGGVIYTDRSCAALGARTTPFPGELLNRIAREQSASTADVDSEPAPAAASMGRRSPMSGCARNKQQLAMDIQGSLVLHDVNRLAESYHWVGKSSQEARQHMVRLERMTTQHLKDDVALFHAQIGGGEMQFASMTRPAVALLQLTFGNGTTQQVMDLEVLRYSGCYFARL